MTEKSVALIEVQKLDVAKLFTADGMTDARPAGGGQQ